MIVSTTNTPVPRKMETIWTSTCLLVSISQPAATMLDEALKTIAVPKKAQIRQITSREMSARLKKLCM